MPSPQRLLSARQRLTTRLKSMTLWDAMVALYEKYGYYKDAVKSIELKGIEGLAKIQEILETLRNNTPVRIGDYHVVSARDYKLDTIKDMKTGEVKPTGLPASNVLYYDLNDGAWLCVRPSGTEPKVKFYYGVKGYFSGGCRQEECCNGRRSTGDDPEDAVRRCTVTKNWWGSSLNCAVTMAVHGTRHRPMRA